MFEKLKTTISDAHRAIVLASSLALGGGLPDLSAAELPKPTAATDKTDKSKAETDIKIPQHILEKAEVQGISRESIKLIDDQWIACESQPGQPETCIVLGKSQKAEVAPAAEIKSNQLKDLRNGDIIKTNRYGEIAQFNLVTLPANQKEGVYKDLGTLTRQSDGLYTFTLKEGVEAKVRVSNRNVAETIDSLPKYKTESPTFSRTKDIQVVRNYLAQHPEEAIIVVVTMPGQCPPCRALDTTVKSLRTGKNIDPTDIKIFFLEYSEPQNAGKEVLGDFGVFPTIVALMPELKKNKFTSIVNQTANVAADKILKPIKDGLQLKHAPFKVILGATGADSMKQLFKDLRK